MTVYEIKSAIEAMFDPETGLIADYDAFEALAMEREAKAENMLLKCKNLDAEAKALAAEIKNLTERKRVTENQLKALKEYTNLLLEGEKFKTAKVAVSYRKSTAVECDDEFIAWAISNDADEYLRYKEPEVNKDAVKTAIKDGKTFEHAKLVENVSMVIK